VKLGGTAGPRVAERGDDGDRTSSVVKHQRCADAHYPIAEDEGRRLNTGALAYFILR
jgi:hypothetical protein